MLDLMHLAFMQHAVWAAILTSILCGMIGSLIVLNRLTMLTGGVAHAAYGGVGIAMVAGLPVFPVTLLFGVGTAALMTFISRIRGVRSDMVIGVIWAAGMALGILLLDLTPGYNVDLMSYLFGGILSVSREDLWLMTALTIGIAAVVLAFYRTLLAVAFDADFAETRGVAVRLVSYAVVMMAAIAVIMMTRVVGLILVIALVTIPTYIALQVARSLAQMMLISGALALAFTLSGLGVAVYADVTAGASIIAVSVVCFVLFLVVEYSRRRAIFASRTPVP